MQELLTVAPIGIATLDADRKVLWSNPFMVELIGCEVGTTFTDFLHPDHLALFDESCSQPGEAFEIRLNCDENTRTVSIVSHALPDNIHGVFMTDVSERVALGRQLRSNQEPGKRLLSQIHNANTTMMGYAELIAVMLEEEDVLDGERMQVVRRYQQELSRSQLTIDRLMKVARYGGRRPPGTVPINRRHIVIVDDEPAIAEYLTELMKGLRHKVTTFNDPTNAAEFSREEGAQIDLVVTDFQMPVMTGLELAETIHHHNADIPILICAEHDLELAEDRQLFQCRKPLDINDLIQIVSEIV